MLCYESKRFNLLLYRLSNKPMKDYSAIHFVAAQSIGQRFGTHVVNRTVCDGYVAAYIASQIPPVRSDRLVRRTTVVDVTGHKYIINLYEYQTT